jgi:HEPN domain-containing protein
MQEVPAYRLHFVSAHLERIEVLVNQWSNQQPDVFDIDREISVKLRFTIARTYASIAKSTEALSAPVTQKAVSRAITALRARKSPLTYRQLGVLNKEVMGRLEDEISSLQYYCIPKSAATYYSPPEPLFGHIVEVRIPEANDDIVEGGKCFAVGRYTASIFHLMRAMETAVQALSSALRIENVEREWGKLLSDIAKKVEAMERGNERDEWSAVHANLYHVKQAWRNSTMHPKRTYTEEEAREVFDAVRAFMRGLAEMLPPSAEELLG